MNAWWATGFSPLFYKYYWRGLQIWIKSLEIQNKKGTNEQLRIYLKKNIYLSSVHFRKNILFTLRPCAVALVLRAVDLCGLFLPTQLLISTWWVAPLGWFPSLYFVDYIFSSSRFSFRLCLIGLIWSTLERRLHAPFTFFRASTDLFRCGKGISRK